MKGGFFLPAFQYQKQKILHSRCQRKLATAAASPLRVHQAFLFVYITMVLLLSILKCLEEPKLSFKKLWTADFLAAGSAGIGAILYYGGLKLSARLTGISLIENNYNSVSNAWTNTEPLAAHFLSCHQGNHD